MHKEPGNVKRSSFLIKTVIPSTYETPVPGRLISTILPFVTERRTILTGESRDEQERFILREAHIQEVILLKV